MADRRYGYATGRQCNEALFKQLDGVSIVQRRNDLLAANQLH
jgi:hypothetical protein